VKEGVDWVSLWDEGFGYDPALNAQAEAQLRQQEEAVALREWWDDFRRRHGI
jgi:hypothetical protein